MQRRGFLRNKLKMMLVSSLRSLAPTVLKGRKGSVLLQRCLSSNPSLSQRSRRVSGQTHKHAFSHIHETILVIFCLHSVSLVFTVRVKVEEVEMETPIDPPDDPQQVSLDIIKQEEGGELSKSGLHQASEQSSMENVAHEKTAQSETAAGRSEELGCAGESNTEQSENKQSSDVERRQKLDQEEGSQGDDDAMDEISESNTEQDTSGEAAGMER